MKTITIKKSELATYKGLGMSADDVATRLEITAKEVTEAMLHFGLTKSRKVAKEYQINLVDDITVSTPVTAESVPA